MGGEVTAVLVDAKGRAHDVEAAVIREPIAGNWQIKGSSMDGVVLTGACVFRFGGSEWHGTIVDELSGAYGERFRFRIAGGANAWGSRLRAKGYHSDSGVRPSLVVSEAAQECGETLGTLAMVASLGIDWARPAGPRSSAASVLDAAAGPDGYWWIGRDGRTNVGKRSSSPWDRVIDWQPENQTATLEADELAKLSVGATITDPRLGGPRVIRELTVRLDGETVRAFGWCGEGANGGRLARAVRALVARTTEGPLWGTYRYQVVSMAAGGRVNLRAARRASGVPDLLPLTAWPGIPGASFELEQGAAVLVEFEEGDRGKPFISHFAPAGSVGFVPVSLALCGGTRPAAGVGDEVTVFMTPGTPVPVSGMLSGAPFSGVATFSSSLRAVITSGSPLVRIP
jgi:hypothetical protein